MKMIQHHEPVIDDSTFALFFAEIDFVPAPLVTNHKPETEDRSYTECGPYAWIPFSEIERCIQTKVDGTMKYSVDKKLLPLGSKTDWFWPAWLGSVRKAAEANSLPWKN